jgi:hypothetical protein
MGRPKYDKTSYADRFFDIVGKCRIDFSLFKKIGESLPAKSKKTNKILDSQE